MLKQNYSLVIISTATDMVYKIQNFLYNIHHTENRFKRTADINIYNLSYANLMYEDLFKENLLHFISMKSWSYF